MRSSTAACSADTPAAAIASAHTPRQRQVVCTLADAAPTARAAHGVGSPAILVVGNVVALGREAITAAALGAREERRATA